MKVKLKKFMKTSRSTESHLALVITQILQILHKQLSPRQNERWNMWYLKQNKIMDLKKQTALTNC